MDEITKLTINTYDNIEILKNKLEDIIDELY